MSALATAADLVLSYDERTIRDLASDTGSPVEGDLDADQVIVRALERGSGTLLGACRVAGAYSEAELAALTGNSAALMKGIICDLAMAYLLRRRPEKYADQEVAKTLEDTEQYLELLRAGKRVFDSHDPVAAGTPTIDGPTATTYERLNLLPDRTRHFYPDRAQRLPIGRG